ncbi:hypothetical protein DFH09DRAFT_1478847 [Mycena vulgaris]|nr:hypothetical protein DFH09DRAFT_1478847 [Mycena vulgaris]
MTQSKVLFPLSSIQFPALRKLRLNFSWTAPHDSDAFHLARGFVGLPSIRDVGLCSLYYNPEPERLAAIFDAFIPHPDSVACVDIFSRSLLPSARVPRSREQRAQIKRLKLVLSDDLDPWLISPQCPFDFSHLIHVVIEAESSLMIKELYCPHIPPSFNVTGARNPLSLSDGPRVAKSRHGVNPAVR